MLAVVVATPGELKAAFRFAEVPALEQGASATSEVGGREILLHVCGVGVVNAAMAAGRLLADSGVAGIVNLGIAGTYDPDVAAMGSAVCASREVWPEYGLLDGSGCVDAEALGFAQGKVDDRPVWDRVDLDPDGAAQRMGLSLSSKWSRSVSVTVSGVSGTPERAEQLRAAYGGGTENMEGFALAFGAAQAGLPFLQVRTVSNLVGSRASEDWDVKGAFAALGEATKRLFS